MHKIYIQDLRVQAIIGILDFERESEQLIIANVIIKYKKIGKKFVNYADIVYKIEQMLKDNRYKLLEDALEDLIESIYKDFKQIKSIRFRLDKPEILNNCLVGVEHFRKF